MAYFFARFPSISRAIVVPFIMRVCTEASGLDAAEILNYKGITLMSLKEYGAAADMLRRAFDKGGHDPVIASAVYRNMWKNLTHQGKHREAAEKLTAALEFYQNEGPLAEKVGEKANIHVNLIAMCCKQGMDEKAEEQTQALIDWIPELYRNMMRIDDEGIRKDQLAKAFYMPSAIFAMTRRYSGILPERAYSVLLCAKDIGKEAEFSLTEHMTPAMVCEALPSDCALLDYLVFYDEERDEAPGGGKNYYLVFLVRDGRIKIFFLGEEAPVNNMLRAARERIVPSPDRSNKPEDAFVELAALYKRLIAPLAVELNGVKHLFIAPDSELFKMPFELLRDKNNQRLSDGFSVSYLSSGRDLVRLKDRGGQNRDFQSAVILADPKYDLLDSDPHPKKRNNANNTPKPPWGRGTVRKCGSLPYTRDEAESLNKVFQGKKMICYQLDARKTALEAAVKEMGPPDIIHIATHGFFAERKTDARWTDDDRMDAHHYMEDPLNRSGLMLAGVNDWLDNRELPVEYGNGILYAKEVLNLNLQGTELITLSACETGLGEAETGMGIQGLRRAFELAGVATVICTLWNVDDASSAILMERFYMNWLEKKMGKLAALDEAKKYLRDMSRDDYAGYFKRKGRAEINGLPLEVYIALEPGEKPREAPFYWAGYVLQGDIA